MFFSGWGGKEGNQGELADKPLDQFLICGNGFCWLIVDDGEKVSGNSAG